MKRRFIPLPQALKEAKEADPRLQPTDGICACYDVTNMGFCKDQTTRWYHFDDINGNPSYTLKY